MSSLREDPFASMDALPAVELDDLGRSSGVEAESIVDDTDDQILVPFDPREIDVTTETRTLDSLTKRLEIDQIDLDPDFQRSRGIWTNDMKSLLIESLLLRIPLPTFYVAEIENDAELGEDRWAVVDGIQRLSTIAEFVIPHVMQEPPLRLTKLEYLDRELGKTFTDLSPALRLRVLESQFTFQVIRKSTPEAVKRNIFARINTGGVPLSAQELRHALTPGPARDLLKRLANEPSFHSAVTGSVSPARMADREMVLRFLAFRIEDPLRHRAQDFNRFLRDAMRTINSWSRDQQEQACSEFVNAMAICEQIFRDDAFRKRYRTTDPRRPVSKALFEAVAVAVASVVDGNPQAGEVLIANRADIRKRFRQLMADPSFDRSISQGTGDPVRVRERFGKLTELMRSFAE